MNTKRYLLRTVALFGALLGSLGIANPASAAGCTLASTNGTVTKTIQGYRSYNLHVPAGLSGSAALLIDLHGANSNAYFQETTSGWSQYADAAKFIVAYPAGNGNTWDLGENSADVAFVRAVVADIKAQYCVDEKRVYAEGGSLGGFMAQRLACDAEDVFASAVSTISGPPNYFGAGCSLSRPVAVGVINSDSDPLFTPAQSIAARDQWIALNHCSTTGAPDPNAYGLNGAMYSGCDAGVHVLWRTYTASGHSYPTGTGLDDLHAKAWSFLLSHPRP